MKLTSLIVLAASSFAMAGEMVEVRLVADTRAVAPATRPAGPIEPSRDAKVLLSIEALADSGGEVDVKCVVDGRTIHLKGQVTTLADGMRRLRIDFSQQDQAGGQGVKTSVELAVNDQRVIGGLSAGNDGPRLVVVTIKPDTRGASAKG